MNRRTWIGLKGIATVVSVLMLLAGQGCSRSEPSARPVSAPPLDAEDPNANNSETDSEATTRPERRIATH